MKTLKRNTVYQGKLDYLCSSEKRLRTYFGASVVWFWRTLLNAVSKSQNVQQWSQDCLQYSAQVARQCSIHLPAKIVLGVFFFCACGRKEKHGKLACNGLGAVAKCGNITSL